jgi:MFS family permease
MRDILKHRGLRLIFIANLVSMVGSGMNSAAVVWFILQRTHSEIALSWLVVLSAIPAMLMLPFTGVIIDREDRRRLVMLLDALRAVIILGVAVLAFAGRVQLWQVYAMNILVAAGFWMFWPTITALIQELTPDAAFSASNSFLLAGVQGGWLLAGAVVGFVYNHIGLGGVLLIDVSSYVVSFLCYLGVRKGRHVVAHPHAHTRPVGNAVRRFLHEYREGLDYVRQRPALALLGAAWALFIGAMMSQNVITAPLSDLELHAGAVGYGWLNAGWGTGAFLSALYAPVAIKMFGAKRGIVWSFALLAACMISLPFSAFIAVASVLYFAMGAARGIAGVGINTVIMEIVPKHFMGRVQNLFYFGATLLQISFSVAVGFAAQRVALRWGFFTVAVVYTLAGLASLGAPKETKLSVPLEAVVTGD